MFCFRRREHYFKMFVGKHLDDYCNHNIVWANIRQFTIYGNEKLELI